MGVVTVSTSAARSPLGLSAEFALNRTTYKRPISLAFKANKHNNTTLVSAQERTSLAAEAPKEQRKKIGRPSKSKRRFKANFSSGESPSTLELDYNEAAAKLESIYKLSPTTDTSNVENVDVITKRNRQRRRKNYNTEGENDDIVVKSRNKKPKRLDLEKRIALRHKKEEKIVASKRKKKDSVQDENEKIENLVREYSSSTDLVSLDWKKIKIPPVLPSSDHAWLFKVMQPMKALLEAKENLQKNLGREPSESELAEATKMSAVQVRKQLEVGHAARNKLIKHNLRLVLFVINKYFHDFANGPKFQDLCQAGVKGLITSIDRFEPTRKFRLSTYSIFWIRHAIIRSMTTSNFTRVSFGLESVRVEIQKAKLELMFELKRTPTEEEIIERVGISPQRYHEVMRASASVLSLHSKHKTTQEEFINAITDVDGVGTDNRRQPALLRLALDDVLDSLKPKESLVVRQRYGLDGKGDRTLGEIAGNLNISREMVRKHEMKAFMKLKHPARVDYLRRYVV